eukprot:1455764-Prymnesium_polylepis.1
MAPVTVQTGTGARGGLGAVGGDGGLGGGTEGGGDAGGGGRSSQQPLQSQPRRARREHVMRSPLRHEVQVKPWQSASHCCGVVGGPGMVDESSTTVPFVQFVPFEPLVQFALATSCSTRRRKCSFVIFEIVSSSNGTSRPPLMLLRVDK